MPNTTQNPTTHQNEKHYDSNEQYKPPYATIRATIHKEFISHSNYDIKKIRAMLQATGNDKLMDTSAHTMLPCKTTPSPLARPPQG